MDFQVHQQRINNFLNLQINHADPDSLRLHEAMAYSLLAGGKRIRPMLVYATARSLGISLKIADHIAAAIEMIHAYSLIHDDLPAMDDDDLRRGKPTNHIAFDEATAILAGDALQSMAFNTLAHTPVEASIIVSMVQTLSQSAGALGMVGGQMLDLEAEGKNVSLEQLQSIHIKKTGALIQACITMVISCSNDLPENDKNNYLNFANNFGMAYQIIDDILDITADTSTLGKPAQSDIKNQKSTYPNLVGLSTAKNMANDHIMSAMNSLEQLSNNEELTSLLHRIATRNH
ncbi:MAG: polyprenyl synthetase family protein [Marinicella sp.]